MEAVSVAAQTTSASSAAGKALRDARGPDKRNAFLLPRAIDAANSWPVKLAFFLDYDGTLTPIVQDPTKAELPAGVRQLLDELSAKYLVAIVSGRPIETLQKFVRLPKLWYAGSHGQEVLKPGTDTPAKFTPTAHSSELDHAQLDLTSKLSHVAGVLVEKTDLTCAVHFRRSASEDLPAVQTVVNDVQARYPALTVGRGKCVYEFKPRGEWNKGRAVRYILDSMGIESSNVTPVFIGDDATDEDAFKELSDEGISCIVLDSETPGPTLARYRVDGPPEVAQILRQFTNR